MNSNIVNIIRRLRISVLHQRCKSTEPIQLKGKVLIIAPHPDDEVIGCGGLIARLCDEGNPPHVIILTGGEGSHRGCCNTSADDIIAARHGLTLDAAKILGLPEENIHCLDFKDGQVAQASCLYDSNSFKNLKDLITEISPDMIFVPHWGEGWPDHVNVAKMVREIASAKAEIYEYCVWMWYYNVWHLDWRNARQVKMTPDEHVKKLAAIDAYVKPCAPCGKPWSGVLPKIFLDANKWNRELYFKVR